MSSMVFRVHTPFLAVNKISARLETIPAGVVIELNDEPQASGLHRVKLRDGEFLAFLSDIQDRAERLGMDVKFSDLAGSDDEVQETCRFQKEAGRTQAHL